MNKPYIICLQFGTWRNELWFSAPNNEKTAAEWDKAIEQLPQISLGCANPGDYLAEAVKHFEANGFTRIQH